MAHDKQYKDEDRPLYMDGVLVRRFAYPKEGESFWNRHTRKIETAHEDMNDKYLIMERGN